MISKKEAEEGKEEIRFETDSFSVYSVIYTVDFHYEVNGKIYEFSIPGGGYVTLQQLVEVLGIANGDASDEIEDKQSESIEDTDLEKQAMLTLAGVRVSERTKEFVADIETVEFSNPELVWIGKADNTTTFSELKDENGLDCQFNAELTVTVPEPEIVAEAVDLGLSVKWATCNLGAESPYMYGYHYAWGETEPKSSFIIDNYKWFDVPSKKYTKYSFDTDFKTVLDTEDDAASKLWGGDWRIPTIDEIGELLNNCSWEFVQERGVYGYKVTSKVPGYTDKSIFLPAAGYNDGINTDYVGYYWSSQLSDPESIAYYLFFNYGGTLGYGNYYRYQGRSIRPVTLFDASDADSLMLDRTDLTLNVGDSYELSLMGKTASG